MTRELENLFLLVLTSDWVRCASVASVALRTIDSARSGTRKFRIVSRLVESVEQFSLFASVRAAYLSNVNLIQARPGWIRNNFAKVSAGLHLWSLINFPFPTNIVYSSRACATTCTSGQPANGYLMKLGCGINLEITIRAASQRRPFVGYSRTAKHLKKLVSLNNQRKSEWIRSADGWRIGKFSISN